MLRHLVTPIVITCLTALPAVAQDIPKRVKFQNPPQPMTCDVGNPFSPPFHTKGASSKMTTIKGTLYIICPTRYAKWKGKRIPINWFDERGNGYTDCDRRPNKRHRCWITVPN